MYIPYPCWNIIRTYIGILQEHIQLPPQEYILRGINTLNAQVFSTFLTGLYSPPRCIYPTCFKIITYWNIPRIFQNIPRIYYNIPRIYTEVPKGKHNPSFGDQRSLYLQNRFSKQKRPELFIRRHRRFLVMRSARGHFFDEKSITRGSIHATFQPSGLAPALI